MQAVGDQTTCALQKLSIFLAEGIQLIALDIQHAENAPVLVVPHRNNDLRPRRMKLREMARIFMHIADNDWFSRV